MSLHHKQFRAARKHGYRSGLELKIAQELDEQGVAYLYEKVKIEWEDLAYRTYTPDFVLNNGIIIEVKGRWTLHDRKKMILVMEQNPELDIRMVFQRDQPLNKGAKTRYSEWCDKRGITYAVGEVPKEWLEE